MSGFVTKLTVLPVHDGLHDASMLELDLGNESEIVDRNDTVVPDNEGSSTGRNILESPKLVTVPDPVCTQRAV